MATKLTLIFRKDLPKLLGSAMLVSGAALFSFGIGSKQPLWEAAGAVGIIFALVQCVGSRWRAKGGSDQGKPVGAPPLAVAAAEPAPASMPRIPPRPPVDPSDTDALVEQMIAQGRVALLLRPQIAGNLNNENFGKALAALTESMALVPDGDVILYEGDTQRLVTVARFFLDRYPVSNQEYYEFVSAGGYRQMSLWDESILPAVLEFLDRTGCPGPKYWSDGCYPPGEERHPVVGVSWYEAEAYARWLGKRLPTDAEWVKAGVWPVPLSNNTRAQRRFPWGDTMDRTRANLYGSGPGCTVPVDQYAGGASVGGVYQLIGNVWEWTTGNYRGRQLPAESLPPDGLPSDLILKNLRGGAFDTYFDNQATCQFVSGENPLGRRHNIGFRCAVGLCDLMLVRPTTDAEKQDQEPCLAESCA